MNQAMRTYFEHHLGWLRVYASTVGGAAIIGLIVVFWFELVDILMAPNHLILPTVHHLPPPYFDPANPVTPEQWELYKSHNRLSHLSDLTTVVLGGAALSYFAYMLLKRQIFWLLVRFGAISRVLALFIHRSSNRFGRLD